MTVENNANDRGTFEYFYEIYMNDIRLRCKMSTLRMKQNVFENKILPFFGKMRICDITPNVIKQWQVEQSSAEFGYSSSYLHYMNAQLSAFMEYVKELCDLPVNPCTRVRSMGSVKNRSSKYWTPEEYFAFRDATKVEPLAYICFETLFWTGIRAGEMLALTPEDIDLKRREITINKTFQKIRGKKYIWEPKTNSSNRTILIPDCLVKELKEHIKNQKSTDEWRRVFPVDIDWLYYRIHKYAKIAGVRDINVHGLRHSAASLLINKGFGALEVSHRLGHSRPSITLNTYSHMFPSRQEDIVNLLDEIDKTSKNQRTRKGPAGK